MSNKTLLIAASALMALSVTAARADVFDPLASYGVSTAFNLAQSTSDESVTITINGYAFDSSVLGNYTFLEPSGTQVSDTINVSNGGPGGWGQITFTSWESSVVAPDGADIVLGTEDADAGGSGALDLPLTLSDGLDLDVKIFSDTIGLPDGISDQLTIDVPEPVSLTLFGTGLFGLGLLRRRRG